MRVVIQRVSEASVSIHSEIKSSIEKGFLILLGIHANDQLHDADWLIQKICGLRIFSDADGKMNLSIKDVRGELLVVSQFTLFASTVKGNRPSFIQSAKPEIAVPMYEYFIQQLSINSGIQVKTGEFGADMQVALVNDGPVTILIDSHNKE